MHVPVKATQGVPNRIDPETSLLDILDKCQSCGNTENVQTLDKLLVTSGTNAHTLDTFFVTFWTSV